MGPERRVKSLLVIRSPQQTRNCKTHFRDVALGKFLFGLESHRTVSRCVSSTGSGDVLRGTGEWGQDRSFVEHPPVAALGSSPRL